MSISNTTETAMMKLVFQAIDWANYADDAVTSPQTSIAVGLHTGDPGDAGTMSTSEVGYTDYARVDVARTTGGWAESSGTINPVANIDFPTGSGGSGTVTYFSTGKTGGGAAAILFSGAVSPSIVTGSGITPRLTVATAISLD